MCAADAHPTLTIAIYYFYYYLGRILCVTVACPLVMTVSSATDRGAFSGCGLSKTREPCIKCGSGLPEECGTEIYQRSTFSTLFAGKQQQCVLWLPACCSNVLHKSTKLLTAISVAHAGGEAWSPHARFVILMTDTWRVKRCIRIIIRIIRATRRAFCAYEPRSSPPH